jgi:O-antigen/teichoic acid export membrane protein
MGIFQPLQKLTVGLLRIRKEALKYSMFNISLFFLQTVCIIFMVVFMNKGLEGQLIGRLVTHIIFFVVSFVILLRYTKLKFQYSVIIKLLKFGIPLIPFFIFTWINEASGRIVLEKFLTLKDVGIFAIAMQFAGLFNLVVTAFDNAILPHYYEIAKTKDGNGNIGKLSSIIVAVFSFILLFIFIITKPMLYILVRNVEYHAAVAYIPALLIAFGLRVIVKFFHLNLMQSKKTKLISFMRGLSSLLLVLLLITNFTNNFFGINNVAISLIGVNLFLIVSGYYFSQKYNYISYETKNIMIICIIFCFLFYIFSSIISGEIVLELILKLIILIVASIFIMRYTNFKYSFRE